MFIQKDFIKLENDNYYNCHLNFIVLYIVSINFLKFTCYILNFLLFYLY